MNVFPQGLSSRWYTALAQARIPAAHTLHDFQAEEGARTAQPEPLQRG